MTPRKKADSEKKAAGKKAVAAQPEAVEEDALEDPSQEIRVERDAVLEEGADESADAVEHGDEAPSQVWVDKMVAFFIGGQRYGLPIDSVQEIQQIVAFSEVPSQGGAVTGMVNLRGAVIPAVDMRLLLGMERVEYTLETPMIMCRRRSRLVALIVDEVQDVMEVPDGCLQAAPAMHSLSDRMIGVCRLESGLVYLLDVDRLLAPLDANGQG